jgi:hypothetical protein
MLREVMLAACNEGRLSMVQHLVGEDARSAMEPLLSNGACSLHIACHGGHLALVKWLVEDCGVPVDLTTNEGTSPFFIACWRGHHHVARFLGGHPGVEVDRACKGSPGCPPMTALDAAQRAGMFATVAMIQELINKSPTEDSQPQMVETSDYGWSPARGVPVIPVPLLSALPSVPESMGSSLGRSGDSGSGGGSGSGTDSWVTLDQLWTHDSLARHSAVEAEAGGDSAVGGPPSLHGPPSLSSVLDDIGELGPPTVGSAGAIWAPSPGYHTHIADEDEPHRRVAALGTAAPSKMLSLGGSDGLPRGSKVDTTKDSPVLQGVAPWPALDRQEGPPSLRREVAELAPLKGPADAVLAQRSDSPVDSSSEPMMVRAARLAGLQRLDGGVALSAGRPSDHGDSVASQTRTLAGGDTDYGSFSSRHGLSMLPWARSVSTDSLLQRQPPPMFMRSRASSSTGNALNAATTCMSGRLIPPWIMEAASHQSKAGRRLHLQPATRGSRMPNT